MSAGEQRPQRPVSASRTEQIYFLRYQYLNASRRLFGGILMQWIDELSGAVAYRHCGANVITASVDNLVFAEPAFLGDAVVLSGCVTYTGNTSMEVRVDTFVEEPDGSRRRINRAYLVMVAIDDDNKPIQVPTLLPETDAEKLEWERGEKRSELRRRRRKEKF